AAATWFTDMMGLPAARAFGPFMAVELAHGLRLDFASTGGPPPRPPHPLPLPPDQVHADLGGPPGPGLDHWARPPPAPAGRGVYFLSPDGHFLEIITRPYGSGAS